MNYYLYNVLRPTSKKYGIAGVEPLLLIEMNNIVHIYTNAKMTTSLIFFCLHLNHPE